MHSGCDSSSTRTFLMPAVLRQQEEEEEKLETGGSGWKGVWLPVTVLPLCTLQGLHYLPGTWCCSSLLVATTLYLPCLSPQAP